MRPAVWVLLTLGWTLLIVSLALNAVLGTQLAVIGLGVLLSAVIVDVGRPRRKRDESGPMND